MVVDHSRLARAVYDIVLPAKTVDGAVLYLTELLARLPPDERVGYLLKPAGENIAPLPDGTLVSVGRVCYPDGQLYKVMTDVPHGGPEWADDGTVEPARYRAFADAASPTPTPDQAPLPATDVDWIMESLHELHDKVDALKAQLDADTEKIQQQIDQAVKNAEATGKALRAVVEPLLPALSGLFGSK